MSDEKSAQGSSRPASLRDEKDEKASVLASQEHVQHVTADLRALDVGLALVAGHAEDPELSPQESKRLRRKIDRHLLPLLFLIYTGACYHQLICVLLFDDLFGSSIH